MMPKMTDFPRKVMFSLSLFVSFLIWKTAGSSSLVAVAGCDGRSDKKELQESIEWKYFYSHFLSRLSYFFFTLVIAGHDHGSPSRPPLHAEGRACPCSHSSEHDTRHDRSLTYHCSKVLRWDPGRQSTNILLTTASSRLQNLESFHFWTKQQLVTIQLYNWRSD